MRYFALFCAFSVVALNSAQPQRDDQSVPVVHQRITDFTGTLSQDEQRRLESKLEQFERETSNQIVVIIISSLEGGSIEDVTLRVAEKNKLGKKGKDNGVLLLVAKDDRQIRIEVGYGLESVLPDATSDQIIRRVIAPKFRQGDFSGGIDAGVDAIMRATKGEFTGDPEGGRTGRHTSPLIALLLFILFGIFSRLFIGGRLHYMGPRGYYSSGGPWWYGGMGGGGGFGGGGGGFSGGGGSFGGGGASGSW